MATPPNSSSPPPLPPTDATSHSLSNLKRTRKATCLRSLVTTPVGAERPLVHVDPASGKADGPHRKKLRTYLGIVARDKVDVTYENWKQVHAAQKDLIWEDIQFKSDLTSKWTLAADKDSVDDTDVRKKAQAIQRQNTTSHVLSRGGYEYLKNKFMDEKRKRKMEEATQSRSIDIVIDSLSPIRRHVKWKMARTKKTGQMTSETAKKIAKKIDSLEEQASQGLFVVHGRQDVLTATIRQLEHPGRVRATGAGVTIKQYFGATPRTSRTSSSMAPEDLE
ncbi:hypothetical protein HKD37_03G007547 [Glycine soja]